MKVLNPIAEIGAPDSGKVITPEMAATLPSTTKYFCPDHDCKDKERRLSFVNSKKRTKHFRHLPSFEHEIDPQTLLHKLAVKWFERRQSITVPAHREVSLAMASQVVHLREEETQCEYRKLERHIPDVRLVSSKGFEFAIEVVVTSDINEEKAKLIHQFGLPTIRIDLSKFYNSNQERCRTDYDFILENLDVLLDDIKNMNWVILPDLKELGEQLDVCQIQIDPSPSPSAPKPTSENTGCVLVILTLGLILLFK